MAKKKAAPVSINNELEEGEELDEGDEAEEGSELGTGSELSIAFKAKGLGLTSTVATFNGVTGDEVLELARRHIGQAYVFGARVPMANAGWTGPWDCAEFVSWCVFQAGGVLFGTRPQHDPILADAYTGYWWEQAQASGSVIPWRDAAGIAGAVVLRRPLSQQTGHIVLSDGKGGTVEAHSTKLGVIAGTLTERRWDCGILVPGLRYLRSDTPPVLKAAAPSLRLTQPLTRGDKVRAVQQRLVALGFMTGSVDGIYGPQTAFAVRQLQVREGLVADGEVGALTRRALWPA